MGDIEARRDPYLLDKESIRPAPKGFLNRLKYIGPGFILSAAVVGSGELIATTTLGARAGFITLWVIIISCLVKIILQLEFGRQSIIRGITVMNMMNKLPGPRLGRGDKNWSLWAWFILWLFKPIQVGGIIGGVAIILNIAFSEISIMVWTIITAIVVISIMLFGYYQVVEKVSLALLGLFTLFTLIAVILVQRTDFAISLPDITEGLSFRLPRTAVGFALAAFGLTGVGGDEILSYNYWCIEKGYARYCGSYATGSEWKTRARGWIRIMHLDAFMSMIVYTLVTIAFYMLGASVLYERGDVPQGYMMIETLSRIYTESIGPAAKNIFLIGSFFVLFSTLFAAVAIRTRVFSDLFGVLGWINFKKLKTRIRTQRMIAIVFPLLWTLAFLLIKLPVLMVTIGGIATFIMLFLIVLAGLYFRFSAVEVDLKPGRAYDIILIISCLAIFLVGLYGVIRLF